MRRRLLAERPTAEDQLKGDHLGQDAPQAPHVVGRGRGPTGGMEDPAVVNIREKERKKIT